MNITVWVKSIILIDAPSNGPPTKILAPTMSPIARGAIFFNGGGGNPQMFKVWYINVTLKGIKDQMDEIN